MILYLSIPAQKPAYNFELLPTVRCQHKKLRQPDKTKFSYLNISILHHNLALNVFPEFDF
jgi:hypothetical protein